LCKSFGFEMLRCTSLGAIGGSQRANFTSPPGRDRCRARRSQKARRAGRIHTENPRTSETEKKRAAGRLPLLRKDELSRQKEYHGLSRKSKGLARTFKRF